MDIYRSNGTLSKQHFSETGLPYIQYGQIHTGKFLTQDDRYITYIDPKHCSNRTVRAQAGDLLLTGVSEDLEGLCRPLFWQGEEVILSQSIILLKFKSEQIDPLYLAYFFKSYDFYYQKYKDSIGVTIHNISLDALRNMHVTVPPLHIQQAISKFLFYLEKICNSKTSGIKKELELRQLQFKALLEQTLSYSLSNSDNTVTRIKTTDSGFALEDLTELSENLYQKLQVKDICTNVYSGNYTTKQEQNNSVENVSNSQYPVYGATGILRTSSNYRFDTSKILIGRVGNPGVVHQAHGKYNVSDNALIVDIDESKCDFNYLYYYLQSCDLNSLANGGAQKCLTATSVKNVKVKLPSLEQQRDIGNFFSTFDNYISNLEKELSLREQQFEFYLNKLFDQL